MALINIYFHYLLWALKGIRFKRICFVSPIDHKQRSHSAVKMQRRTASFFTISNDNMAEARTTSEVVMRLEKYAILVKGINT